MGGCGVARRRDTAARRSGHAHLQGRQILDTPIEAVERVEIEWAPQPAEHYLADRTSFDAFIEYRRPDGRRGFLGIETKLTEPFSRRHEDRPEYRRWMAGSASPWLPTAAGFRDLPLDRVVDAWTVAASTESQREWIAAFRTRYLDLAQSDAVSERDTPGGAVQRAVTGGRVVARRAA